MERKVSDDDAKAAVELATEDPGPCGKAVRAVVLLMGEPGIGFTEAVRAIERVTEMRIREFDPRWGN